MKKNAIIRFLTKPYVYAIIFSIVLIACTTYSLLDVFVIPHYISAATDTSNNSDTSSTTSSSASTEASNTGNVTTTSTSYEDDNIKVTITTIEKYDTTIYVADVEVSSPEYLQTALANNAYGTNVTATTSDTAESVNAILAINGDYYGANKTGYVIKNGTVYRSSVRDDYENGDLVIYEDGSFGIIYENEISAQELVDSGVVQLFAFGPSLVEDSEIQVSTTTEVDQSMTSNPRTAIGIIDECHYILVVSDGRTSESEGLSLYELATIMQDYGCTTAYNLDGGGSSTMYFLGEVVNKPTTNGKTIKERAVSDIVYIGY
ncbi:MAG: phosphodiester glycosidase family protein [Lachnospira sp.]|nr:phosphodiester glycosidase family protein [Lachnospira sp.]